MLRLGYFGPGWRKYLISNPPQILEGSGRLAIQVNLTCAWCAREVDGVEGERDLASGRVLLAQPSSLFRLLGGRPVCVECGGPLFIENWRRARTTPKLTARDFQDEEEAPAAA